MIARGASRVTNTFAYGRSPAARGQGVVDQSSRRSLLDTTLPSLGDITQIVDDDLVYYRLPSTIFDVDKPWFRIDLRNPPSVGSLASMATISYNGPITMIDHLRGATRTEDLGDESVAGTNTKHFKVTVSLTKTVEQAPAAIKDSVRLLADRTRQSLNGRDAITTEVWIEPKSGLVKRQRSAFVAGGQNYRFDVTYDGKASTRRLNPPPESQVSDGSEL